MLIKRAALLDGRVVDIRVGATIDEVGHRLDPQPGDDVYDARDTTVVPGLHDHHVHLRAAAAALSSIRVGPPRVRDRAQLQRVLHQAPVDADGWIRAVGYHDSVAGPLDAALLDIVAPPTPVRVQHRSGAMWALNSAGLARIAGDAPADGVYYRRDPTIRQSSAPPLRPLSELMARYGVTGVTDATPGYTAADIENFSKARESGEFAQRLHCMAVAGTDSTAQVSVGPAKMILDDPTLDLDALQRWITDNHAAGHPVAVHAVTDSQLLVTIAAMRAASTRTGDRIEHAAVVPADCVEDLVELGVTVVTQPNFIAERGAEYLTDVPAAQHDQLWRVASLQRAGVPIALSTDTPFGDADPWATMRAAVHRRTTTGAVVGEAERITAAAALSAFFGKPEAPAVPSRIASGEPGDLCILSGSPADVLGQLNAALVRSTIIGGRLIFG